MGITTAEKLAPGRPLFKIVFGALSLILIFNLAIGLYEKQVEQSQTQSTIPPPETNKKVLATTTQKAGQGLPVRLKIPKINVDTAVEYVGLTTYGAMDVPVNTTDVGWYKLGTIPGEIGSAVIAGHVDGGIAKSGVFTNLHKLKDGDKIDVIGDRGTTATFMVRESRLYSPGYADEVFLANDNGIHLNLVTCDGVWDGAKKSYSKRLVVFADQVI